MTDDRRSSAVEWASRPVLSDRLNTLVEHGILQRRAYRADGSGGGRSTCSRRQVATWSRSFADRVRQLPESDPPTAASPVNMPQVIMGVGRYRRTTAPDRN